MLIKRVGIIGGGQLAWMMAAAAKKLGVELVIQTDSAEDPAVSIAQETVFAVVDDADATKILASKCDVITFENEFVNLDALSILEKQGICFRPRLAALAPLLDKYDQRCYLQNLGLPVPKFFALEQNESLIDRIESLGFPLVLKSRRHGYDGQGTFIIQDFASLKKVISEIIKKSISQPLFLLEEFVAFDKELAIMAARSINGEVVTYPVVETQQEQQVCRRVIAPAKITSEQMVIIEAIAHTLLNHLQVVGVFGIELFLTSDGKVLINEVAPRTHNSGHFSLDACETSQFEQHLRAVCGLPLGNTALRSSAVMVNLLGYENSDSEYQSQRQQIAAIPDAHVHWYGKTESRPGRKLGHVTVMLAAENPEELGQVIARNIESIWYPS